MKQFEQYDVSFAVAMRKIMLYEKWRNNEDRLRMWQLVQQWLADFTKTHPTQVNCFFSSEYSFPGKDNSYKRRDIFIVNQNYEVAYLCTAFNCKAFFYRARTANGRRFKKLATKPVRDPVYYIVASPGQSLGEVEIIRCIQQYLRSYPQDTSIPRLADTTICLFSEEQGMKLDKFIHTEAKKAAAN